jgi:hypothetical protein
MDIVCFFAWTPDMLIVLNTGQGIVYRSAVVNAACAVLPFSFAEIVGRYNGTPFTEVHK